MHQFRFGIEEEYFVVDRRTASIRCELPKTFMKAAGRKLGSHLMSELLQSQIEVATKPMSSPRASWINSGASYGAELRRISSLLFIMQCGEKAGRQRKHCVRSQSGFVHQQRPGISFSIQRQRRSGLLI